MISGVMPRKKQILHTCVAAFIFLVFAGAGVVNAQFLLPSHGSDDPVWRVIAFLFILLAIGIIAGQVWFRRRIIREFTYDGATLRYKTLASSEPHTRMASQLVMIRAWAGRGGVMGYRLIFHDAPKAYLEDDTPNAELLVEHLLRDMPQPVSPRAR
jgi:hypothetical protein